jgi:hypothetical protein
MSGEATSIDLGRRGAPSTRTGLRRRRSTAGAPGELSRPQAGVRVAGVMLGAIVALSLFIVLIAANRPSLLAPATTNGYYPHWMSGPLGGLLPGLTDNSTTLRFLFTGAVVLMFCAYVWVLRCAPRMPLGWVLGSILAVHAIFLISPPLALGDMFNYINYARMEVLHNLNPYTTIPVLEPHSDPSYALSNWHQLLSPYGPLFTLMTFAVVPLGVAGSFWALKGILVAASLLTILLVWKCARLLGREPKSAIVLVGLNPIVLVWGLGAGHNDFLMILAMMVGFYLLLRVHTWDRPADAAGAAGAPRGGPASLGAAWDGRRGAARLSGLLAALRAWTVPLSAPQIGAGAAFVAAAGIKASAAVLIPIVLAGLLRYPRALVQVLIGMLAAAAVVAASSLLAFGLHIPDLNTQGSVVTSESIPNLIGLAIGAGGESEALRKVMVAALLASIVACCWLAWRRRKTITAAGWASVALLVTLSWVLPWYVLWVLPLAALSSSVRLRRVALALGVYLIIAWAPVSSLLWNAIGFHPERTALGRLHQRTVRELLN